MSVFLWLANSGLAFLMCKLRFFDGRAQIFEQLYSFYSSLSDRLNFIKFTLIEDPQEFHSEWMHFLLVHGRN